MKRRGFTILEMTFVTVIMAMLVIGMASVMSASITSFNTTSNQYYVDTGASTALQYINRDVQEAKEVKLVSPSSIKIYYPKVEADGTYNRNLLDPDHTVEIYRGDKDGKANEHGLFIIRKPADETFRTICGSVTFLEFVRVSANSVDVSLRTERKTDTGSRKGDMVHRTILLRNS